MKKVFLSVAIIAIALTVNAQESGSDAKPFKFSIGVEAGLPLGDFKEISSFGIGGSAQAEYSVATMLGITLSAGYISFTGKTIDLGVLGKEKFPSTSIVPVLAGAKIYFGGKAYLHPQIGMSFFNNDGGSAFTYAPAVGVMASENVDISIKYQAATKDGSTLSFVGLRVAYVF